MRREKFQNIAEVKSRMQIIAPNVFFIKSNSQLGKVLKQNLKFINLKKHENTF